MLFMMGGKIGADDWTTAIKSKSLSGSLLYAILSRVEIGPMITLGKPAGCGIQIIVERVLRKPREGTTEEELFAAQPHLKPVDIRAILAYVGGTLAWEEMIFYQDGPSQRPRHWLSFLAYESSENSRE
jgi:uncharacterized protein (DUF433 family)